MRESERAGRIRRATWGLAAATLLFVGIPGVGAAAPPTQPTTVVYPTGVHPDDGAAVQAAVDTGGTVLLESVDANGVPTAFEFGPPDTGAVVELTTDVEIIGASDGATTIHGGPLPFLGTEHSTTRIEGITFDAPQLSAAVFIRSTGAEFVGNRVTGVTGVELVFPFVATEGRGVKFLGNSDPLGAIVGDIVVADNVFDDMHADLSDAVVFDSVAADVTIAGNVIEDIGGAGVLVIVPGGDVVVDDNTIRPGPGSNPEWHFGNGVLAVGSAGGRYTVTDNVIHCENPLADPVLILAHVDSDPSFDLGRVDAPLVAGNNIATATDEFGAITFYGDVHDGRVLSNRVHGSGLYALGVVPFLVGETATGNVFRGNNLTGFTSSLADTLVFSHASATKVIGNAGSVLDLATDTVITGEGPVAGGLAPDGLGPAGLEAVLRARGGSVP